MARVCRRKRFYIFLSAVCLVCTVLSSCEWLEKLLTHDPLYDIHGTVTLSVKGKPTDPPTPLEGVSVEFYKVKGVNEDGSYNTELLASTETDAEGYYFIGQYVSGTYTLKYTKTGYNPASNLAFNPAEQGNVSYNITMSKKPGWTG